MGKIALNEWPLSGTRIASLNVRLWANAPCPTVSGQTHFQTLAAASALPTFGRSFSLSTERCCLPVR